MKDGEDEDKGGKVHEIKRKDQGKLPGVVPPHINRLEDIEEEIKANKGKIAKLRSDNRELSDEAVAIWDEKKLTGTRVTEGEEWYVDEAKRTYKNRRFKDTKQEPGKKAANKSKAATG